jgi:replicative DNA helicase
MDTYPIYIDLNFTSSTEQIEATIRKYLSLYGTKVVYIDYIQLLSERDADQTQELGRISRRLKLLSNQLDITSVVLSQLNRDVEHRDNKRPVSADLRQCGNLEEDADFIIGLYRDEVYDKETKDKNKMEFIILKQRNGPTGMVKLGFDGTTAQIKED